MNKKKKKTNLFGTKELQLHILRAEYGCKPLVANPLSRALIYHKWVYIYRALAIMLERILHRNGVIIKNFYVSNSNLEIKMTMFKFHDRRYSSLIINWRLTLPTIERTREEFILKWMIFLIGWLKTQHFDQKSIVLFILK